ncbi:MAG: replicative DNA helicase [Bacteroidales bacterium]|nr:replicative DNA helicase [Bacteroidales bacterium]MCF8388329.1 replicative DNA helicase [Bacteroidales bacterium]MCF8398060.1 replicative DNA helicase [Bacteroidales bacterium]
MDEPKNQKDTQRKRSRKPAVNQFFMEHGKVPPQAVDLEEAVLGAIMLEKDALTAVIDILKPEVFYKDAHRKIYEAIARLFAKSEPVDILTVTEELKNSGELDIVGGPYYITQLTNRIASAANVEYHVRIIAQKFIQRELIRISSEIIKEAYEDTTDVFDLLDKAEQGLFSVSETNLRRNYDDMQSLVKEAITEIQAAKDQEAHLRGVPSGFTEIDRVTSGWQKSDLIIIASRPGMGKTAFTLSMARNIAVEFKKSVAVFSLEMSSVQLVTRLISSETQLSAEKLRKGNLENYEWEQLNAKINNLVDSKIFIDDTPALTIFELRAKCRRLKAQHDIDVIFIDYLQLMSGTAESKGNREQEISNISRSLKSLAKELNVPIIALSQLSRAVETRGGSKKPILSDLRESGAIEQDADLVLFIYRAEYYKIDVDEEGNSTTGMAEISIAKHRNGALKDVPLRFIAKYAKFEDLDADDFDITEDDPSAGFDYPNGNTRTVPSRMNDDMDDGDDVPF